MQYALMRIEYFACHCGNADVWSGGKTYVRNAETVRPVIPWVFVSVNSPIKRNVRTGSIVDLYLSYKRVRKRAMTV